MTFSETDTTKNQVIFKINAFIKGESNSFSEKELDSSNLHLNPMDGVDGEIVVSDGENEISIFDELWYLAINMCFNASEKLANKESFEFSQYTALGTVNLVSLGEETIVSTEEKSATFEGDLSKNFRACGDRILAFLIAQFSENEDFSSTIADIVKARDHSILRDSK
jgi:hypothetical protein